MCALGPDQVGIHSISLAARYRTAACSITLNEGLEKIQAARGYNFAPILALGSLGLVSNHNFSPLAGFVTTLISLPVVVIVITLVKLWKIRSIRTETTSLPMVCSQPLFTCSLYSALKYFV